MRRTRLETGIEGLRRSTEIIVWLRRSTEILKFIKEIKKSLKGKNLTFPGFKKLSKLRTWHCMNMLKLISKDR